MKVWGTELDCPIKNPHKIAEMTQDLRRRLDESFFRKDYAVCYAALLGFG